MLYNQPIMNAMIRYFHLLFLHLSEGIMGMGEYFVKATTETQYLKWDLHQNRSDFCTHAVSLNESLHKFFEELTLPIFRDISIICRPEFKTL